MAADTVSSTGSDGLNRWDLLDPEAFLAEIADCVALTPGRVLLALVDEPATRQRVRGVTVLWKGRGPRDETDVDDALVEAMHRLGVGDGDWSEDRRRSSAIVVVVIRRGRTFSRAADWRPSFRYFYTRQYARPMLGDVILVTEHGWSVLGEDVHGLVPRAAEDDMDAGMPATVPAWDR